jgi:hypothetical protein
MFHIFRFIYPLHFDVKDIHMRMHIFFHENFTHRKPDKLRVSIFYKEQ